MGVIKKVAVVQITKTGRMDWFAPMLSDIVNRLPGYTSYFVDGNAALCQPETDIILMMSFNKYNLDFFEPYRKKAKIIAHLQCEQLQLLEREKGPLRQLQDKKLIDVSLEMIPDHYEQSKKFFSVPTFLMPLGYDESMTLYQQANKEPINWDVFRVEFVNSWSSRRTKYYDTIRLLSWKKQKGSHMQYNNNLPLYDRYRIAYFVRNSKICISIHSQYSEAMASLRTISNFIANKGFILHELCPNYPFLKDGKDIVYFNSPDDALDKIIYYTEHQEEARKIAESAYEHFRKNVRLDTFLLNGLNFVSGMI